MVGKNEKEECPAHKCKPFMLMSYLAASIFDLRYRCICEVSFLLNLIFEPQKIT